MNEQEKISRIVEKFLEEAIAEVRKELTPPVLDSLWRGSRACAWRKEKGWKISRFRKTVLNRIEAASTRYVLEMPEPEVSRMLSALNEFWGGCKCCELPTSTATAEKLSKIPDRKARMRLRAIFHEVAWNKTIHDRTVGGWEKFIR